MSGLLDYQTTAGGAATGYPGLLNQALRARQIDRSTLRPPVLTQEQREWVEKKMIQKGLLNEEFAKYAGPNSKAFNNAMNVIGMAPLGITVWHGSPEKFNKFSSDKAGKRGGTSFGLGHNLSEDASHAKAYKGDGGSLYKVDLSDDSIPKMLQWETKAPDDLLKKLPTVTESGPFPFGGGSSIEEVGGAWKLKTSDGTSFNISEREVRRMFGNDGTGEQVYRRLVAALGGDEAAASAWLSERGVPGIANRTERNAKNYTVFPGNEGLLNILERF